MQYICKNPSIYRCRRRRRPTKSIAECLRSARVMIWMWSELSTYKETLFCRRRSAAAALRCSFVAFSHKMGINYYLFISIHLYLLFILSRSLPRTLPRFACVLCIHYTN